ncbi:MAG: hypothetical protein JWO35_907 [Candidatus Saccharibacteria bacterium]|nr:hypothetical protein [Candidatus Saccharibacteria bacterium]
MYYMLQPENAIGKTIVTADMIGSLEDFQGRCVEAEIVVGVAELPPSHIVGRFTLQLATKEHYAIEAVKDTLDGIDEPDLFVDVDAMERRLPYVLNDAEITEQVVREKFLGRMIREDLAASLWPLED